jgi:DNA-binding NtrC family response regulator
VKTLLAITTSDEVKQLLTTALSSEYDIILSSTVEDGISLLDHIQPEVLLLEQPSRMELLYEIHARAAGICITVLTGEKAWPVAIQEITARTARSGNCIRLQPVLAVVEDNA